MSSQELYFVLYQTLFLSSYTLNTLMPGELCALSVFLAGVQSRRNYQCFW